MTIYATPFKRPEMIATAPSIDSGFKSLDDVLAAIPDEPKHVAARFISYEEICFSDFPFKLEESGIDD